jgi:hypothetical protein
MANREQPVIPAVRSLAARSSKANMMREVVKMLASKSVLRIESAPALLKPTLCPSLVSKQK